MFVKFNFKERKENARYYIRVHADLIETKIEYS